ncbi:AtpZ/AtpI family protein [Flavobacterium pallidum]|uniref:F0F1-ATPase subunit n=1 Tax=Flavobacterium pallidum TaxID=2172098 RepID=A0A2S1SFB1_9FLAO|nr:AtpZ/AtpI family protein [Flavobacterium pallidum]AWI25051.1 F0F1-ATPase subunit [Flavobacterium pallidum]
MTPDNTPKRKPNKWLALINIPIQMGIIVFAFAWAGKWLDGKYHNENGLWVKVLTIAGVGIAFYNINRQLKDINKSDQ